MDNLVPNTAELLLRRADDDSVALLFEDDSWTWREFVIESARRAAMLDELFDAHPDLPRNFGVMMDNTAEYMFLLGAAVLSGNTIVGINTTRRGQELARDISHTDCLVVLTEDTCIGLADGLYLGDIEVINTDAGEYTERLRRYDGVEPHATERALNPETTLFLLFTSGSTGAPKAVVCSTRRFAVMVQYNPIAFTADDVAYSAMPLFHGNALMALWGPCINHGAAFAIRRKFSASGFLPDVIKFQATAFSYVGRALAYVLSQPEHPDEKRHKLRFGFGTEASAKDRAEFLRRYGFALMESYGSSEGTVAIIPSPDMPSRSLGKPMDGTPVDIVNSAGELCPRAVLNERHEVLNPEAIGEMVVRGAAARFEGYYNNPGAVLAKVRDGDYYTGDLAYIDEDGWYYFAGRTADWMRVDSENIATAPIEAFLTNFPDVTAAFVYPLPDPRTGDQVATALTVTDSFDIDSFAEQVRSHPDLSTKGRPKILRILDEAPLTATSKIDRVKLRRWGWQGEKVYRWDGSSYVLLDDDGQRAMDEEAAAHA